MRILGNFAMAAMCVSPTPAQLGRAAPAVGSGVPARVMSALAVPSGTPSGGRTLPSPNSHLPGGWPTHALTALPAVHRLAAPVGRVSASLAAAPAVAALPRPTKAFEGAVLPGVRLAEEAVSALGVGSGRAVNDSQEILSRIFDARRRSDGRTAAFEEAPAPKAGVPAAAARVAEDFWREMSRLRAPAAFRLARDEAPRLYESLEQLQGHDAYARIWREAVDAASPRASDRRMPREAVDSLESLGRSRVVAVSDGGFWTNARIVAGRAGMQGPLLVVFEPGAVIDMAALIIPGPRPAAYLHHLLHNTEKMGIMRAIEKAAREQVGATAIRFSRGEAWFSEGSFHEQGRLLGRRAPISLKALAAVWTARLREAFPPGNPRSPIAAVLLTAFDWVADWMRGVSAMGRGVQS